MTYQPAYFRLLDDVGAPRRWFLGSPRTVSGKAIDAARFTRCQRVDISEALTTSIRKPGEPLDVTLADFAMPVIARPLADRIAVIAHDDCQLIDTTIDGTPGAFAILNVLAARPCLDEVASVYDRYPEDDEDADLAGKYRTVYKLMIDPRRTGGASMLRIEGWPPPIVLRDDIAAVFAEYSGTVLAPCS